MNLIDAVRRDVVSPFHLEKIGLIDAHDFSPVKKKMKTDAAKRGETFTDDEMERGILSLKQYYAVALLDPLNDHAVSDKVDPFWHTHMLFSEEYTEMCQDVVGGFMHHEPLDHDDADELKRIGDVYRYTRECYHKFFSHVDEEFNPLNVTDERLICYHRGNQVEKPRYGQDVLSNALLPTKEFSFA